MRMRVHRGNALDVTGVPALVVPTSRQLTLGWGSHVAGAVLRRAGRDVEREARARHPEGVALGEAVLTSAGRLENFSHLVHAAVLDKWSLNPLFLLKLRERTREPTLRGATRASLRLADEAGLSGLVFTPMGAGIGGMRDARCAGIMLEEVRAFESSAVRDVVFACRKEKTARVFQAEIDGGS